MQIHAQFENLEREYLLIAKPSGSLTVGMPTIWMPNCRSRTIRLITCMHGGSQEPLLADCQHCGMASWM